MAEVKILIEGYTSEELGDEKTCATIALVRDQDIIMITDPGVLERQEDLIQKLKEENLTVNDINVVFITHSHIDHYRNIGMFPTAKTLEFYGLWDKNTVDDWDEQFTKDIKIIKTPGHNSNSLTLLVETKEGKVAICGDVFWEKDFSEVDPYASDKEKLKESRKKVLEIADWIIPGHGPMFRNE